MTEANLQSFFLQLPNVREKFLEHDIMGYVSEIFLKPRRVLSKFECQPETNEYNKMLTIEQSLNESIPCSETTNTQSTVLDDSFTDQTSHCYFIIF